MAFDRSELRALDYLLLDRGGLWKSLEFPTLGGCLTLEKLVNVPSVPRFFVTGLVHGGVFVADRSAVAVHAGTKCCAVAVSKYVRILEDSQQEQMFARRRSGDWICRAGTNSVWLDEHVGKFPRISGQLLPVGFGKIAIDQVGPVLIHNSKVQMGFQCGSGPRVFPVDHETNIVRIRFNQTNGCRYPSSLLDFETLPALIKRFFSLPEAAIRGYSRIGIRCGLIFVCGVEFVPLSTREQGVESKHRYAESVNTILKILLLLLLLALALYSIYCGIGNFQLVNDWRGFVYFYG